MRFWITKNSELSIREQMVRQVLLGILSEDLPAGHKLPSVRAVARQHHIHSNTVSAAYHDLLEQGWLELRHGSGLYVRPLDNSGDGQGELDRLLTKLLQEARRQGHEPEAVLRGSNTYSSRLPTSAFSLLNRTQRCARFFKRKLPNMWVFQSNSSRSAISRSLAGA